ncbi:HNH endonuclease [Paenibacillus silvestris]|nr:HNH endonuclease signature motif containing protein [Paenibacillus silvestris]
MSKIKFRVNDPKKRELPYAPERSYKSYRSELMEDFQGRCGYCNSYFGIIKKDYHIDHFVPQRIILKSRTHNHLLNDYKNLVLSCPTCNGSKSGKWPSEDPDKSIVSEQGFVDPSDQSYSDMFFRDNNGRIHPNESNLANYIHKELKLYLRKHQIVWSIENVISILKSKELNDENEMLTLLLSLLTEHFEIDKFN